MPTRLLHRKSGLLLACGSTSSLLANLISYWKLDEASGSRLDSVVASANDLTAGSGAGATAGKFNNCVTLDGTVNAKLTIATNASLQVGNLDFTFAGWYYTGTLAGSRDLLANGDSSGNSGAYYIRQNAGTNFQFIIQNGGTFRTVSATTFGAPSINTFYFLICEFISAANTVNISVNNGTADSASCSGTTPATTGGTFSLGGSNAGTANNVSGRMDEWGFWKRQLTVAEKASLYNAGVGRTYPFVGT